MTDHAKRLAEIEAAHAREEQIIALGCEPSARHVERGWLLAERRAASEALTAAGILEDMGSLAERVALLHHDADQQTSLSTRMMSEREDASEALAVAGVPDDGRALAERVKALAAERDRFRAAIVAANNAIAEVCHGDHEHQIECHADTLPAEHRRVAVAAEQASGILAEVVLDIVEQGSRAGADDATEAAEALARCARGEHRKAGETMPGSCADCGVDWGDLDTEDGPATGLDVALVGDAEGMAALVGLDASRPVEQTAGAAARCLHESAAYGPNMPLRHGSARTKVCTGCGAYKLVTWHDKDYSGWRSTDVHADVALAEAESEDL